MDRVDSTVLERARAARLDSNLGLDMLGREWETTLSWQLSSRDGGSDANRDA